MPGRPTRWLPAALVLLPIVAHAADAAPVTVELNKLEPVPAANGQPQGCRAYLVANNPEGDEGLDVLRLDMVVFSGDGVITRRLAVDLGPLPAGRTQVRVFELRDQACDGLGQLLVNDVLQCKVGGADRTDCLARLRPSSRTSAKLTK